MFIDVYTKVKIKMRKKKKTEKISLIIKQWILYITTIFHLIGYDFSAVLLVNFAIWMMNFHFQDYSTFMEKVSPLTNTEPCTI